VFFDTLVRTVIVAIAVSFFAGDVLHISVLFVPVFFVAILCCFGVGLFLAILCIAFGDLAKIVAIFLQYGIFVSGVIFPLDRLGWLADYAAFNPLYIAIDSIRSLIVLGSYAPSMSFFSHIGLGLCVLLWGLGALYVLKDSLRGRL
jgi:ABC-type polysaccharide/polyol phosphate export permease